MEKQIQIGGNKTYTPVVKGLAVLGGLAIEDGVEGEVAVVQEVIREARLMIAAGELDALAFYRVSRVVIQGAGMVAALLKTKRILAGDGEDNLESIMGPIIEELFIENGWEE